MFIIHDYSTAVIFCIVTMICWGSWANTQKLAAGTWRFELSRAIAKHVIGPLYVFSLVFHPDKCQAAPLPHSLNGFPAAHWIAAPAADLHGYGVFHFRRSFPLASRPASFPIFLSADQRYRLFVNGRSVCCGPARGDSAHWRLDSIDIAAFLHQGRNTLAAVVWNDGENTAWAQLSLMTGLFMEGRTRGTSVVDTDSSWKVWEDEAYTPVASIPHITGAFEQVFGQRYPWGWERPGYDDGLWPSAVVAEHPGRKFVPREIPFPEERVQRLQAVRQPGKDGSAIRPAKETDTAPGFLKGDSPMIVLPWSDTRILLDQQELTTAYPVLLLSGGKGARITLTYAEALYDKNGRKGDRNAIAGKEIRGNQDIFLPDGGDHRLFSPLYYRTYRYIELHIENHQQPLVLHDLYGNFTAYPFEEKAKFATDDTLLAKIWVAGWRTARLCAFETYMDCPYYEQLQYVGDTRIQALISLYVSGDDRLMKNAMWLIDQSMLPEGITQSRYPCNNRQIIPPFSLFWISMLHDFWMLRRDDHFLLGLLPGIRQILDWHERYIGPDGMLGVLPYWNFVDWTRQWPWKGKEEISGIPEGGLTGRSSILTLQYVLALQKAAALYGYFGRKEESAMFLQRAERCRSAVYRSCWDAEKELIAETPERRSFSQHAQAMAILTGTVPAAREKDCIRRTLADSSLVQCSYYYRFYLLQAMKKASLGSEYLRQLTPWKNMIDSGLTTFAESPEPTRSDCHAWSASPLYDFLATVCGIMPATPGFREVRIEPCLGQLTRCQGSMPHPDGAIQVVYREMAGNVWHASISLPMGVKGVFVWRGKSYPIHAGENSFVLPRNVRRHSTT